MVNWVYRWPGQAWDVTCPENWHNSWIIYLRRLGTGCACASIRDSRDLVKQRKTWVLWSEWFKRFRKTSLNLLIFPQRKKNTINLSIFFLRGETIIYYLTCLKPRYMTRISCLVNLVSFRRSSRAIGRYFWTRLLVSSSNATASSTPLSSSDILRRGTNSWPPGWRCIGGDRDSTLHRYEVYCFNICFVLKIIFMYT